MPRNERQSTNRQLRQSTRLLSRFNRQLARFSGGRAGGGSADGSGGGFGGVDVVISRFLGPFGLILSGVVKEITGSLSRTLATRQTAAQLGVSATEFAALADRLRELGVSEGGIQSAVQEGAFISRTTGVSLREGVVRARSSIGADPFVGAQLGLGELAATGRADLGPGIGLRRSSADFEKALRVNAAATRAAVQFDRTKDKLFIPTFVPDFFGTRDVTGF